MKKTPRKPLKPKAPRTGTTLATVVPANPTPIIALSLEQGTLIAMFTPPESPEPTEVRFAIDKPFNKVISAPARKCHQASAMFRDEKAGSDRRATLAFIPTPKGTRPEGAVFYRAKLGKHESFFSATTQRLESLERDKLGKLIFVLVTQFKAVVAAALPSTHELSNEVTRIEKLRAAADEWNRVQGLVRKKLEDKDAEGALALLEPLVYCKTPLPAAEKLLGEMLLKARKKGEEPVEEGETSATVEALMTARLLLEYGLARAQLAGG